MSVKLNLCNRIVITKDDPSFEPMKDLLTIVEKTLVIKKQYDEDLRRYKKVNSSKNVIKCLYDIDENNLYVPYGLYKYVKYLFKNSDVSYAGIKDHLIMNTIDVVDNIEKYRNILTGISLYDNQLEAIKRIFEYKRGVIQAGTGFGKTEIMCATTKILKDVNNGQYPTVLVLEPTIELLKGIEQRFKKYKIPVNNYRETRMILKNKVNLAHPKSLCSDLLKNKNLLDKIEVQFVDECLSERSKILLPDNCEVTIKEIYENPYITEVMSYNEEKNIYEKKKIIRKIRQEFNGNFYRIKYLNPTDNKIYYLDCTGNHKIWTSNRGYVCCDELTLNDIIKIDTNIKNKLYVYSKCGFVTKRGSALGGHIGGFHNVKILEILKPRGGKKAKYKYNLEVEDNHNYWANGILVSNCHHGSALTFSTPTQYMSNLMYSIGLSATFLSHYHADGKNIDDFNYEELRRIGACGPIIMKIDGKDLIENQQLATPKLCILNNKANEEIDETKLDYTWQNVSKIRLQSDARTKLIAQAASVFIKHGYKVIILMNFLDWGRRIMTEIYNLGYGDYVRTCFGGQTYEKINKKTGKVEKEWNSTLSLFDKDKIYCIIGSSCIQEGLDLSKVDVCILAQGGKSDRTTLQSVGRALRKSKTGNFAYIIDFNDSEDQMLNKQFIERYVKYKRVLGITNSDDILKNCNIKQLEEKFIEWEDIK